VYQPEKVQADIHLLFFILLAFLFYRLVLCLFIVLWNSLCFFLLCGNDVLFSALFCVCMFLAFLVMMPMFMVHLWLPVAHSEVAVADDFARPTRLHCPHSDTHTCIVSVFGQRTFLSACCFRLSSDSEISHVTTTRSV